MIYKNISGRNTGGALSVRNISPADQVRAIRISGTLEKNQLMQELLDDSTPQQTFILDRQMKDGGWDWARRLRDEWSKRPPKLNACKSYASYHERVDNALRKIARDRLGHLKLHICAQCLKQYVQRRYFVNYARASHHHCPHFPQATKDDACASAYYKTEGIHYRHADEHDIRPLS